MRHNLNMQIESRIRNRSQQRANDGAEDEELRYGRVGEAGGDHCRVGWESGEGGGYAVAIAIEVIITWSDEASWLGW